MFEAKQDPTKLLKAAIGQAIMKPSVGVGIPPSWNEVERYALNAPFAYAVVADDPVSSAKMYFLD